MNVVTVGKGLITVACTAAASALIGGLAGSLRGRLAPSYYRSLFLNGHRPDFDTVAIGTNLGIEQGAVAGLVIGVLLVAIVAWHDVARARPMIDARG